MKYTLLSLFAATAFLSGCITGGSGGNPAVTDGFEKVVGPYTVVNGKIITPASYDTSYYCSGTFLETIIDTSGPDSVSFELNGNGINFVGGPEDTLPSGAIMALVITADRSGSGSGLEGTWTYRTYSYRVLSGAPTSDEQAKMDSALARINQEFTLTTDQVRFNGGLLSVFMDPKSAEKFVADWNGLNESDKVYTDSARYDVTLRVTGKHTVELKGGKTGETVNLTLDANGEKTYASNMADHLAYHYVPNAKTCPNLEEPTWYSDFLLANSRGTLNGGTDPTKKKRSATAEIRSKTKIPGFFRLFPLKIPGSLLN